MILLHFTGGSSLSAKAVQFVTRSWCSHVEVELPNGHLIGAVPGEGVCVRNSFSGGISCEDVNIRRERYCIETSIDKEQLIYGWLYDQIGKPYDWSAVFGFISRENWNDSSKWFCSELVEAALRSVDLGLLRNSEETWRITPRDLLLSQKLIRMQ